MLTVPAMTDFPDTLAFARKLDKADPLRVFRERFYIPVKDNKKVVYFTGNSLGLQPKSLKKYIEQELTDWKNLGVEGHFQAKNPWVSYHKVLTEQTARLVGALPSEVVVMNSLTVNLHLFMTSFYRPKTNRYKILMEAGSFSSDQYVVESQVKLHGLNPETAIIEAHPREGEFTLRTEDIIQLIQKHKEELALVFFGGVNYYTGQVFDLKAITEAAHEAGALAGYDLAHAVGNVRLSLHDWNVDFAGWCSYKYLNAGPGGVAGAFVHQKHGKNFSLPRLAGWWGHNEEERFKMLKGFQPMEGAEGWQLSNAPVLSMAAYKASLDIFDEAGMDALIEKSRSLAGLLEFVLIREAEKNPSDKKYQIKIITPGAFEERGCQVSIYVQENSKELFDKLMQEGFWVDYRYPSVIRAAPVPLYNTHEEVFRFAKYLGSLCSYIKE
ncbi:MAG TPA: kynureninase [Cytophagaceae bacterium]